MTDFFDFILDLVITLGEAMLGLLVWLLILFVPVIIIGILWGVCYLMSHWKVIRLAPTVRQLLDEMNTMHDPNNSVSREDIERFMAQYRDTYADVDQLVNSSVLSNSVKEKYKLQVFVDSYRNLWNIPQWRPKQVAHFTVIQSNIVNSRRELNDLFSDNTYLTWSAKEQYLEKYEPLQNAIKSSQAEGSFNYLPVEIQQSCEAFVAETKIIEEKRKRHNDNFKKKQLEKCSSYFESLLDYPLDQQQREAIVNLEDNTLVISAAGGGKTTTIIAKIKYLIEKQEVDPSKILLITYTRKACEELNRRLPFDGLNCMTFHSLALRIIGTTTGRMPSICDESLLSRIYDQLIETPEFLKSINHYLLKYTSITQNEHQYQDSKEYYYDRRKFGIKSLFRDMDGHSIYTKSEQERRISHFLHCNSIRFRYEAPYPFDTANERYRQYKPDFTIYYTIDGEAKQLYLEHFAIDSHGNVPPFFARNESLESANRRYNEGIVWKRAMHRRQGTTLIETTSAMFYDGTWIEKLTQQLEYNGVALNPISDEQKYADIVRSLSQIEESIITLISSFINLMKSNLLDFNQIKRCAEERADRRSIFLLEKIISPVLIEYSNALTQRSEIDFTDAIIQATNICTQNEALRNFDYIIVDEFQDISKDRYEFIKSLRRKSPLTKTFCVGDDWQSIFRFAGSDMALFYDFAKFFGCTTECHIETTYRFGNPLIEKSSQFILENDKQIRKEVKPASSNTKTHILLHEYNSDVDQAEMILREVSSIPGEQSIYILGRYRSSYNALINNSHGRIIRNRRFNDHVLLNINGRVCEYLTIHKAKGLEADEIFVINCSSDFYGFPSNVSDDPLLSYVLSDSDSFEYAEERRLFYVALTRSRKNVHILYDKRAPSIFIREFQEIPESDLCPRCGLSRRKIIKEGISVNGQSYTTYGCAGNYRCDYIETIFH